MHGGRRTAGGIHRIGGVKRLAVAVVAVVALAGCTIQLGSPTNVFGNDPTRSGTQPGLWAAINGPFSNHEDGDPFATECSGENGGTATSCGSTDARGAAVTNPNPQYNPNGYLWAVDIPAADAGTTVTVSIYDPSFGPNSALAESYSGANTGFSTSFQLFDSSGSSSISTDQSLGMNSVANGPAGGAQGLDLCTGGTPGYRVFAPGTTSQNAWFPLCTFTVPAGFGGGIYPLQVKTSAIPGVADAGTGINAFSVKAVGSVATQPSVYALSQLSTWTSTSGPSTARFYLANIGQWWAGHSMVVDVYDPGDGSSGNETLQILEPPSGVPAYVPTSGTSLACNYSAPSATQGGNPSLSAPDCTIQTRSTTSNPQNLYNERWLRILITIPSTYTCSTDCWWTVKYTDSGLTTDRAVWIVNLGPAAS